jgi:two-component system chemotaxis response regulator CheB
MGKKESIAATCPECRGPLTVFRTESLVEVRCLVGHAYSPQGLLQAHSDTQEKARWSAVVSLRETEAMVEATSDQFSPEVLARLREQVEKKQSQAASIVAVLENLEPFEIDSRTSDPK